MDELGRVIANLMNSLPSDGAENPAPPEGAAAPFPAAAPAGGEPAAEAAAGGGAEEGSIGDLASLLPGIGGGDLMGMLGAMGGGMPPDNHKMQLLIALKPYLRPERCDRIDRLCRLMDTAYGVRGALRSLGGIFHV